MYYKNSRFSSETKYCVKTGRLAKSRTRKFADIFELKLVYLEKEGFSGRINSKFIFLIFFTISPNPYRYKRFARKTSSTSEMKELIVEELITK